MRVAVTGACGHLGANLVRVLADESHNVRALYRSTESLKSLENLNVEKIKIDVLEPETLKHAFQDIDVVMHLAAVISIDGDHDGRVMRTNVLGTRNVAAACLASGVQKLIHLSSIHAFKIHKTDGEIDEHHPPADTTCFKYDLSKALGEREVLTCVEQGLDATILNPTGILGPDDYGPSHAGHMLRAIFRGGMPILVKGGFDWVDARDVAAAAIKAVEHGRCGERYLLAGHWTDFQELSHLCNDVTGNTVRRWTVPISAARLGLPFARLSDTVLGRAPLFTNESLHIIEHASRKISSAKACRELDYQSRPLKDTLTDTFAWWRAQGQV